MQFLRWLNNPITYIYVVIAIFLFVGVMSSKPSQFDSNPTDPNPIVAILILSVGLLIVRTAWSVIKIVWGSYSSASTGKPEKNAGKPFSFWDF